MKNWREIILIALSIIFSIHVLTLVYIGVTQQRVNLILAVVPGLLILFIGFRIFDEFEE